MSAMIDFLGNFFVIRGEGTMESLKVETRKFHGSWEKRNRPGRAENGVNAEREGRWNGWSCATDGRRLNKVKGTVWGKIKNTGSGNRTWGLAHNRHAINSYWTDVNPIQNWATEHVFEKGKVYSSAKCNSNFQKGLKGIFPGVYRNQITPSKKVWMFAVWEKGKLISAESKACTWKEEEFTIKRMFRRKMGRIWYKERLWVC